MKNESKAPLVFLFSGQGSHYYQMGKELFDNHSLFRQYSLSLDQTARELTGESILEKLYDPLKKKSVPFTRVTHTHPAIFILQYSLARVFLDEGIRPDYVLGASMGEFVSAAIAGIMPAEKILEAVVVQAETLEKYCPSGGMTAILSKPELYYSEPEMRQNSELAATTFDSHFVVAAGRENLGKVGAFLRKKEIIHQSLPVSVAFHSSDLDAAKPEYLEFLARQSFAPPEIPFISSCRACRMTSLPKDYFWQIGRRLIRFQETINYLEERGSYIYVDLGPSGVLANWAKYNIKPDSKSKTLSVLLPSGGEVRRVQETLRKLSVYKTSFFKSLEPKSKMKTFLFPGQGSQKKGMGAGLFERYSDLTARADEILGYSIKKLCLEDSDGLLQQTQYTQPALYTINAFSYFKTLEDSGQRPDFSCGHSLGEYNALLAAGVFNFETGLKLVQKRGSLMAEASGGGMIAVIGLKEQELKSLLKENFLEALDIANYNSYSQLVVSGQKSDIEKATVVFKNEKIMAIPLKVSAPFHSRYMKPALEEFRRFLKKFEFSSHVLPVISNVQARPYPTEENKIKDILAAQIASPVRWYDSVNYLLDQGEMEFDEIGPGNVLSGLLRRIRKERPSPSPKPEETAKPLETKTSPEVSLKKRPSTTLKETKENPLEASFKAKDFSETKSQKEILSEPAAATSEITAVSLGNTAFKKKFGLKYAYLGGGMYRGIASAELVTALGKGGMMGSFGGGGLDNDSIASAMDEIQRELGDKPFGLNLLHNYMDPQVEERLVDLALERGMRNLEAAAFMRITPALVRYRLKGLERRENGDIRILNRIIGKISRPEVATAFLSPPPERIVEQLLETRQITPLQAELGAKLPMADALCVEADSGGHTDRGAASALMPAVLSLRDSLVKKYGYQEPIFVGSAGGIGSPEAAAAAFVLGADFILTGSINQCSVESATSEAVKDMLCNMNVQDTDYAPAGDMFEVGAKVQVLKKGVFFPARGSRLYELYKQYNSLEDIDPKTRKQLEEKYFKKSFEEIYQEVESFFQKRDPKQIAKAEKNPKHKMALVFRWYFGQTSNWALKGETARQVDFQIHTGPALGAFNQWVKDSELEDWRNRRVAEIGVKLMEETASLLNQRFADLKSVN